MNNIQANYTQAKAALMDAIEKKHATEDALNVMVRDWSTLSDEEIQAECELDASIEAFFGLDVIRQQYQDAKKALIEWGIDHAMSLPEAKPYHAMLMTFRQKMQGTAAYEERIINLTLRLQA